MVGITKTYPPTCIIFNELFNYSLLLTIFHFTTTVIFSNPIIHRVNDSHKNNLESSFLFPNFKLS